MKIIKNAITSKIVGFVDKDNNLVQTATDEYFPELLKSIEVAGGVSVLEVSAKTTEKKIVDGVRVIGKEDRLFMSALTETLEKAGYSLEESGTGTQEAVKIKVVGRRGKECRI